MLAKVRMELFELPDLSFRAPAKIAVPRVPQTSVGDRFDPALGVESRGNLMGDALVLNEAVCASGLNGLLVQAHGIGVPTFDARDFGRHQSGAVLEILRAMLRPDR